MVTFADRVKGVVFGTAYGDAMGAVVEKMTFNEIHEKYGRVETTMTKWWKADWSEDKRLGRMRGEGIVTDDTLMTLALMNVYGIERRHLDAYDLANEFVKEISFRPKYIPELGKVTMVMDRLFYPEKHIFNRHVLANCEPREGGYGNMVNCGAAMYISPIGMVNACNPKAAYDEAILFASGHQVSYGLEAAGVLAACVAKAFEPGVTVEDIIQTALMYAKDGTKHAIQDLSDTARSLKPIKNNRAEVVGQLHAAMAKYSPMGDDVNRSIHKVGIPSNHYTPSRLFSIEELPLALAYIILHDGDLLEAVKDGVSSGRDTDSIGVMAGAILGAMHGVTAIPQDEIAIIEQINKQEIEKHCNEFIEAASFIIEQDLALSNLRQQQIRSII
ncbi:ADP-ribosylglycohydrolase family protein [Paenibacillus chondroitinus]|uniref:ADP-ribosylglycohydrolase family protein n=1 Tax=Paenibacillus chondroitinus TaxID=59842 RepID=A0ABU6DNZ8_9BACL|nr:MULTISPECIES: ADP-ribosylglycohydrolase family protein [Paenibacillus]MCY9660386.1 ADP-ribosylglycohydrolase family protein [Paenibacillus anseongense]MEB4799042.1 ADP-ribosylglycohydrolase family protein [Paenibacillus chondroitinus]